MNHKDPNPWLKYLGLTAQLLVLLGVAVYAAIWLDKKLGVSPLFLILLPLLVLGTTFYQLYKETIRKKNDSV
ncbi:AtpZ/AtpI family protein [Niabella sp. CC-SYL272]|uniref:AtpZ/AtpI family protein n=1 Tax=Niabella agricola TaxID=2891571 RepID=UPI001F3219E8|nr:AtpZ/AtpI family protein [Niabella agricola]MCF3111584.1 AtpZ/AtpI family protein [Niabella agricola]